MVGQRPSRALLDGDHRPRRPRRQPCRPQTDERGGEYVGYSLVVEVRDGDIVFHFDRNIGEIVGWSRAVGGPYTGTIEWAARGTSYRQSGGAGGYQRPGWFFNLEGPYYLDEPVTLGWLRDHEAEIRAARAALGRVSKVIATR
jgi:hypothetical protein